MNGNKIKFKEIASSKLASTTLTPGQFLFTTDTKNLYLDTDTERISIGGKSLINDLSTQSNWSQTDSTKIDYIKNKPTIPSAPSTASSTVKGISKLYNTTGTNTDGAITQKAATDAIEEKAGTKIYYGVCNTDSSTVEKTVSIDGVSSFDEGAIFLIEFANTNFATSPTLKINSTAAKPILKGSSAVPVGASEGGIVGGNILFFRYDSKAYSIIGSMNSNRLIDSLITTGSSSKIPVTLSNVTTSSTGNNSTAGFRRSNSMYYKESTKTLTVPNLEGNASTATKLATARNINGVAFDGSKDITIPTGSNKTNFYGVCETAAIKTEKTVTVDESFVLEKDVCVTVNFSNGSDVTTPTLNVNSTGAKTIIHNGITASNLLFFEKNGVYNFIYDGTQWILVGVKEAYIYASNTNTNYPVLFNYNTSYSAGEKLLKLRKDNGGDFTYNPSTNTLKVTNVTGNSSSATKLQTARTIAGKSFDGTANITLTASDVGAKPASWVYPQNSTGTTKYVGFLKIDNDKLVQNSANGATYLISGIGTWGSAAVPGSYLLSFSTTQGLRINIKALESSKGGAFGYWADNTNNKIIIGFQVADYNYPVSVELLNRTTYYDGISLGKHYESTTQPTGWTSIGGERYLTEYDLKGLETGGNYASKDIYGDTAVSLGRKSGSTVGTNSFAFGNNTEASGNYSYAEGYETRSTAESAHAEGSNSQALGVNSHAEGYGTRVTGASAHAEGYQTEATKASAHAEGYQTAATGQYSHTEGWSTKAKDSCTHAEGYYCQAIGMYSHAEGRNTKASGQCAHSSGYYTTAENFAASVIGKYNNAMDDSGFSNLQKGDAFVVGNGTSETALSNAFRVTYAGDIKGTKAFQSSGADYAEFIKPWYDDNEPNEDRIGYFVTVKAGKLYKANEGDYICGITSGNPSVVGNADEDYYWKYERDEFNRIVMEDVPEEIQKIETVQVMDAIQKKDEEGNLLFDENNNPITEEIAKLDEEGNPIYEERLVFDEKTGEPVMIETGKIIKNARMKLADDYDSSKQKDYIERKYRKEWDYVGMVGVLPVRDDGTCIIGEYCKCGQDGIATLAEKRDFDTFMVLDRINENIVSVILK